MFAALTQPLPPSRLLGNFLLAIAVIVPCLVLCVPSILASMVATGLAVRAKGGMRVMRWPVGPDDVIPLVILAGGSAWTVALYLFATT